MQLKGAAGTLLAGGRVAARLRNWTMEHLDVGSVIRAAVEPADPFWLAHCSRFDIVLQVGLQSWRWRGIEVLIAQGHMRAQVEGKPQTKSTPHGVEVRK